MASRAQRAVPDVTDPEAWRRFGRALRDWREDVLGYDTCTRFARARGINLKLVRNLENAYRPGSYIKESMKKAARAYGLSYASMLAFLRGEADELAAAAPPAPAPPPPDEATPPMSPERADAVRPWFDEVNEQRVRLAAQGITNPTGTQMFGAGTADAAAWDDHAHWSVADRVWFIAALRRWVAGQNPNSGTGTAGALTSQLVRSLVPA